MPMIEYVPKRFSAASEALIETAEQICREYARQGYDLTLRQLYYQFVSRDVLPNSTQSYRRLGSVVNDARLAGRIDWSHLVDRGRNLRGQQHWNDPAQIVRAIGSSYLTDRWDTQDIRLEVWVEKDALSGVVARPCREVDVDYFACKGYTSQSEMWSAGQRLARYERGGQATRIIHLGDHDPSGIDMTRDIQDRLRMFGARTEVRRIALNMDQVEQYNPPPNPAKLDDPRATDYIDQFGRVSWELDALDPTVLGQLIRDQVDQVRDMEAWNEATDVMEEERRNLTAVSEHWDRVSAFLDGIRGE
jgi:hypothetical protein